MTILAELNTLLSDMSIQTETAKLSDKALDEYVVLVPISDNFSLFCDEFLIFWFLFWIIALILNNSLIASKRKVIQFFLSISVI